MKILKPGKNPNKTKKFICKKCKCIFECEEGECEYHFDQREGGYYHAFCPTCGNLVYIKE